MTGVVEMCHCGQPLHYTNRDIERMVRSLIAETDEYVVVRCAGRSWKVQRHYIALHGLRGADIPSLGFEEIVDHDSVQ